MLTMNQNLKMHNHVEYLRSILPDIWSKETNIGNKVIPIIVPYQDEFISRALADPIGIFLGEGPPGCGKSRILANCAVHYVKLKLKVLVVCPNPTALGSKIQGIIKEFDTCFKEHGLDSILLGNIHEPNKEHAVIFLTPGDLISLRNNTVHFKQILSVRDVMLVDEVHHFGEPEDDDTLTDYRLINTLAHEHFSNKKTIGVTGSCYRLDGLKTLGKDKPDYRITIQQMVNANYFPTIRGIEVFLDIESNGAKINGDEYLLSFDEVNMRTYWQAIVDSMKETMLKIPFPLACFASGKRNIPSLENVSETREIARLFNEQTGLGDPLQGGTGIGVLLSDTSQSDRQKIITLCKNSGDAFYSGNSHAAACWGFVTCGVGVEAIDIPPLRVAHLVRRTCSIGRQVQSIGRILRAFKNKGFCLVIDYHLKEEEIIRACHGENNDPFPVGLLEFAKIAGCDSKIENINQGGILIGTRQDRLYKEDFIGSKMSEMREWIGKQSYSNKDVKDIVSDLFKQGEHIVANDQAEIEYERDNDGKLTTRITRMLKR